MEFDKSKVYTALNADEVKVGSKGFFADSLQGLEDRVKNETNLLIVQSINYKDYSHRFHADDEYNWVLFYLVEEPKELTYEEKLQMSLKEWLDNQGYYEPISLERYKDYNGTYKQLEYAIKNKIDIADFDDWQSLQRVFKHSMEYFYFEKINTLLWEQGINICDCE